MNRTLLRVVFIVSLVSLLAGVALAIPPVTQTDEDGKVIRPICGTDEVWEMKKEQFPEIYGSPAAACPLEGACDDPTTRDNGDQNAITVDVIVHVVRSGSGASPSGLSQSDVDAQIAEMNADYSAHNIQFNLAATEWHDDSSYYCISAYHPFSTSWYSDIQNAKATYFHDTDTHLNILITCQDSSRWGILLGIGTFPWDPAALTNQGGLWVNSQFVGSGNKTASHEVGHCLGLWHTFHGVDETSGCSDPCTENAHPVGDAAADYVGDLCAETPATPVNYDCSEPGGTDCTGTSWTAYGSTNPSNIMGYGPDSCIDHFTSDQGARMHCWTRDALEGWFGGGSGPSTPVADFSGSPTSGEVPLTVSFTDQSSNSPTSWSWNFGDGVGTSTAQNPQYIYNSAGTYTVSLTATNSAGSDTETKVDYVSVTAGCTDTAPSAPSNLVATTVSDTEVDLSWSDNSGNEDGFKIERDGNQIATVGADVTSYSDTGLDCETSYTYQVRAYNCGGDSPYSNQAAATTGTCPAGPTVHVSSIDLSVRTRGPWVNGEGTVTIVDAGGNPVSGATVFADWSGTTSSSQSATTGSNGEAFFESNRERTSSYCWTLTVTNVTASGATYDSGANAETSDQVGNSCASRLLPARDITLTNHPNPFNPTTTFRFSLTEASDMTLKVYDVAGRLVTTLADEFRGGGVHEIQWNGVGSNGVTAPSGIYYARLVAGDVVQVRRIVLLK